jgi:hypothetical protein
MSFHDGKNIQILALPSKIVSKEDEKFNDIFWNLSIFGWRQTSVTLMHVNNPNVVCTMHQVQYHYLLTTSCTPLQCIYQIISLFQLRQ